MESCLRWFLLTTEWSCKIAVYVTDQFCMWGSNMSYLVHILSLLITNQPGGDKRAFTSSLSSTNLGCSRILKDFLLPGNISWCTNLRPPSLCHVDLRMVLSCSQLLSMEGRCLLRLACHPCFQSHWHGGSLKVSGLRLLWDELFGFFFKLCLSLSHLSSMLVTQCSFYTRDSPPEGLGTHHSQDAQAWERPMAFSLPFGKSAQICFPLRNFPDCLTKKYTLSPFLLLDFSSHNIYHHLVLHQIFM